MIQTVFPRCPDCGGEMHLLRDVEETLKGAPRTWWCPRCTTHLRRVGDVWDILDLDADGRLIRRAAPWGGAHWLRAIQALVADARLTPTARMVGVALLSHADAHGQVRADLHTLAQWAGCSWKTAWTASRALACAGWVTWRGRRFVGGVYQVAAVPPDRPAHHM